VIALVLRQVAWIRTALGLFPHPKSRVVPFQYRNWEGYRERSFSEKQVQDLLEAFLSGDAGLRVCHTNRHRTTYRIDPSPERHFPVFLKFYNCRSLPMLSPKTYICSLHSQKAFRLSFLLADRHVETARVLFYLRDRRRNMGANGLLATEGIPDCINLRVWVRKQYPGLNREEKEIMMKHLAEYVARVNRRGILHGDLSSNLLMIPDQKRFYMIDLDSIRIVGPMLKRDRIKQFRRFINHLPEIKSDKEMPKILYRIYEERYQE
jgi:hypothetical protein